MGGGNEEKEGEQSADQARTAETQAQGLSVVTVTMNLLLRRRPNANVVGGRR